MKFDFEKFAEDRDRVIEELKDTTIDRFSEIALYLAMIESVLFAMTSILASMDGKDGDQ